MCIAFSNGQDTQIPVAGAAEKADNGASAGKGISIDPNVSVLSPGSNQNSGPVANNNSPSNGAPGGTGGSGGVGGAGGAGGAGGGGGGGAGGAGGSTGGGGGGGGGKRGPLRCCCGK